MDAIIMNMNCVIDVRFGFPFLFFFFLVQNQMHVELAAYKIQDQFNYGKNTFS